MKVVHLVKLCFIIYIFNKDLYVLFNSFNSSLVFYDIIINQFKNVLFILIIWLLMSIVAKYTHKYIL